MVRTVLVTAAGSGLGPETALPAAPLGARVAGTARPDDTADVRARAAASRAGGAVEPVVPDVTDAAMSAAGSREAAPVPPRWRR